MPDPREDTPRPAVRARTQPEPEERNEEAPCWNCDGTGRAVVCDEHWWVPDTSGMTRECGLCGAPERWIKEYTPGAPDGEAETA